MRRPVAICIAHCFLRSVISSQPKAECTFYKYHTLYVFICSLIHNCIFKKYLDRNSYNSWLFLLFETIHIFVSFYWWGNSLMMSFWDAYDILIFQIIIVRHESNGSKKVCTTSILFMNRYLFIQKKTYPDKCPRYDYFTVLTHLYPLGIKWYNIIKFNFYFVKKYRNII